MSSLCTTLIRTLAIMLSLFTLLDAGVLMTDARAEELTPHIDLAVSFQADTGMLIGTAKVTIPARTAISFHLQDLRISTILLSQTHRENMVLQPDSGALLSIPPHGSPQTLFISYEKRVEDGFLNSISNRAIVLTSGWHPVPNQKATFSLQAQVPEGFTAISESDFFPAKNRGDSVFFSFSQPVYALTFAAAPYGVKKRQVREGLQVYTLFFEEEKDLAEAYLDSAASFINRYEELIGPFPYHHYAIVANVKPTGFGLPTFTLLGSQIIRLPFIRQTSLGHEILHSWFGNSVAISEHSGNWCEGLATYLADLAYREDSGDGAQARKETIQNFLDYAKPTTPPLRDFHGVGHEGAGNRAERAVGYGRSAMLFHELHQKAGDEIFLTSIRRFYDKFRGRSASWDDVKTVFEQESKSSLESFFNQRLDSIALPSLEIIDLSTRQTSDNTLFSFTVVQKQAEPFEFMLDFRVRTVSGTFSFTRLVTDATMKFSLELDSRPLELLIDAEYNVMRQLTSPERTPTWASIIGAEHGTVVLARDAEREIFQPFLDLAESNSWHITDGATLTSEELTNHQIIFLGTSSEHSRRLFADPLHPKTGLTVDVRFNPLDRDKTIALISSNSVEETTAAINRLSHYGKYSFLHFEAGRIIEKTIAPSTNGLLIPLQDRPVGLAVSQLSGFERVVEQLSAYRVVYIGEQHTSRADHLLQSMLIEALYEHNPNLVIGMEMFPRSSQQALDNYINDSSIAETDFLKDSRYHDVWGYDFRLFRPIFAFAKNHRIPVVGLNIDRDIVSSLFKNSTTDGLTSEQQALLPLDRKLDLPGYTERLATTLAAHDGSMRSAGSLAGFIQAQALWDESMAESIYRYLQENPSTQMVVLAGSQHTRKDSGIPPRVSRRMSVSQATVGNLATSSADGELLSSTTDYLFLLEAGAFAPLGKIGVVLQPSANKDLPGMEIIDINPASDALKGGLRTGDILVAINGRQIRTMQDIRSAMVDRTVGESIDVVVNRIVTQGEYEEIKAEVILFDPAASSPHP